MPRSVKWRPSKVVVGRSHSMRTASAVSSSIPARVRASGRASPSASYSARWPPEPMPRSIRPPLITSRVAAAFASCAGGRSVTLLTSVSSPMRSVAVATAASAAHGSSIGVLLGPMPGNGTRWSVTEK